MLVIRATALNELKKKKSPTGDNVRFSYRWEIDTATGEKRLVKDGETNISEEINSYLEETKIENIVRRAAFDPSVLERFGFHEDDLRGDVVDVTLMPGTLAEAQNQMIQLEQMFHKLPPEKRALFDNDYTKFINAYGSEPWMKALGLITEEEYKARIEEAQKAQGTQESKE